MQLYVKRGSFGNLGRYSKFVVKCSSLPSQFILSLRKKDGKMGKSCKNYT